MPIAFYRYLCDVTEVNQIKRERKIQTRNPALVTWYSPTRYEDPDQAKRELALFTRPTHRLGPMPGDAMPTFRIGLRPVAPANGEPGGGIEACTEEPVYLPGLFSWNRGECEV